MWGLCMGVTPTGRGPPPPRTARASGAAILLQLLPELLPTWRGSGPDPGSWVFEDVPDISPLGPRTSPSVSKLHSSPRKGGC